MSGSLLHENRTLRRTVVGLTAAGAVLALAACGTSVATTEQAAPSPSVSKKKSSSPSPTPSATPKPTYTRKATPSPTPTKAAAPIFVASLPDSVSAAVGQRIVVQLPTEQNERWSASASGGVTVTGTTFVAPPEDQPDAPGTSITNITAKKAGSAKVTFTSKSTNGKPNATQTLTIKIK